MGNLERRPRVQTRREYLIFGLKVAGITAASCWIPSSERAESLNIPQDYLKLYQQYGEEFWTVLASIGEQETEDGRSTLPGVKSGLNKVGCCAGPMQFNTINKPISTWAAYGKAYQGHEKPDPTKTPNIYDPKDTIPSARDLLLDLGIRKNQWKAVDAYSGSMHGYADKVLQRALAYQQKYSEKPSIVSLARPKN